MLTICDNQYASLFYHDDKKIVHHRLHESLDSEHLREVLTRGVQLLKEYGAQKWLSDNRVIPAHSPEDTEWINTVWLPTAVAAGWKYWALVVPKDTIARINMKEFVDVFYKYGVRIMAFVHPDDALRWLINVDQ